MFSRLFHKYHQLVFALAVYLAFTLLLFVANVLPALGEQYGTLETLEPIAEMIMGMVAIPLFALVLPLWLARRWGLEFAFWPRRKSWLLGVGVVVLYMFLSHQQAWAQLATMNIAAGDFLLHFIATMMFHISYYPLFAVLLMPVLRRYFGLGVALVVTSALFALYHLATFYYFPEGVTLSWQITLFAAFLVNLLFYLWTENLILIALAHNLGGSVGLAMNGAFFNQVSPLFLVALALTVSLFSYMIVYELRHRARPYKAGWWLQTAITARAPEPPPALSHHETDAGVGMA